MSGPELDREFKALLVAVRPLLPSVPQATLASSVRWLQKLSTLPPTQRCLRNQHLHLLHEQLAAGTVGPPFDSEPPKGLLSALPSVTDKQILKVKADSKCDDPKPGAGDTSPRSDAKVLIDEARAMLRNARHGDCQQQNTEWQAKKEQTTTPKPMSNDDEWSDISDTSEGGETFTSGDLTLVAGTGHERCILLHRKHLLQLANQSARIRRYEAALKHFLDNPTLLLGDQVTSVDCNASVTALQQQLDITKKKLFEAEKEKTESQRLAREANQQLQACQQLTKSDSENFANQLTALNGKLHSYQQQLRVNEEAAARQLSTVKGELKSCQRQLHVDAESFQKQLAILNGKLQSHQQQLRANDDAAARELATVKGELKACQLRLRADAESFRMQLAALNGEMDAGEEESKKQLAAHDKKAQLQLCALREQMQREAEDKMSAAKKKISSLRKVIRRYDELKHQWSDEFERKIQRLQIEKDLQVTKMRLEVQAERASFPLTSGSEQMFTELEAKYQTLARQHEESSWRQRQRDLRRISELERELETRAMHTHSS